MTYRIKCFNLKELIKPKMTVLCVGIKRADSFKIGVYNVDIRLYNVFTV